MNEIDELADIQVGAELHKMAAPTGLIGAGLGGIAGLAKAYIGEGDASMQEPGKKRLRRYLGHALAGAGIGAGLEFAASGKGKGAVEPATGGGGSAGSEKGTGAGGTAAAAAPSAPPARSKNWVEKSVDALGGETSYPDAALGKLFPISAAGQQMNIPMAGAGGVLGTMAGTGLEIARNAAKPYVRAALRKTNFQGIPQVRQLTAMRDAVAGKSIHDGDGLASVALNKLTEKGIPDLERPPLTWFRKGDTGAEKFQKQWQSDVIPALRSEAGRTAQQGTMSTFKDQETASASDANAKAEAAKSHWEQRRSSLLQEARAGGAGGNASPAQKMLTAKVLEALLRGKDVSHFPTGIRARAQALADALRASPEAEAIAGPDKLRAGAAERYSKAIQQAEEAKATAEKGVTEPSASVPKSRPPSSRPGANPKAQESRPRSRAEELYQSFLSAAKGGEKSKEDVGAKGKPSKGMTWRNGILPGAGALTGLLTGASVPKPLPRDPGKFEDAR